MSDFRNITFTNAFSSTIKGTQFSKFPGGACPRTPSFRMLTHSSLRTCYTAQVHSGTGWPRVVAVQWHVIKECMGASISSRKFWARIPRWKPFTWGDHFLCFLWQFGGGQFYAYRIIKALILSQKFISLTPDPKKDRVSAPKYNRLMFGA